MMERMSRQRRNLSGKKSDVLLTIRYSWSEWSMAWHGSVGEPDPGPDSDFLIWYLL